MATTSEARALPFFTDLYGSPLESGSIYIGQGGLDPVAYPAVVTSDVAGSVVLQQPIRTVHGHATAAGALVHMFCAIPYSITILDSAGRVVYASLNETDPIALAIGSSSVQSAADLAELRSRSRSSTNQVWVTGFGMYVYVPTDTTSPESVPTIVVGNDGARYHLDAFYVEAKTVHVSGTTSANVPGTWLTWNDFGTSESVITNNQGSGAGGLILRNVNAGNTVETGRVTITSSGGISAQSDIATSHNVIAGGGIVALTSDGSKAIQWDGANYNFAGAQLNINGSQAANDGNLQAKMSPRMATIFQTKTVGGLTLTTGSAPGDPGTWSAIVTGVGSTGVSMWVRTA
ncbi:hypothetical protein [Paraburkholderia sp. BL9I2N2]|uniref:hypothetical protein n=1 Tax=Paraburkholderia sp. BL9I2N2 TaxID=1938809 RepID=UPI001045BAA6|nr:hypothetical protein [Paraburkholderia sp. BL9I2N2]TCK87370.1 hypothetical protein B0G74_7909 [Paraburkholderia sp. BL9I2N2]